MMEQLFKERREKLDVFKSLRKKEKEPVAKRIEVPENLYTACPGCGATLLTESLEENWRVCPECGRHMPLDSARRIALVADGGTFSETGASIGRQDPLHFPGYAQKVASLEKRTGLREAVVTGICRIGGYKAVLGVMDNRFLMGSMGSAAGEKITRAIELATKRKLPLIFFTASGGARMQEGIYSLMQMAKTSNAVARHNQAGLLYISIFTHPTTGGVTASFASQGDIMLAEPGALIGFAGPRVIEQTIRQQLPEDFQTAEFVEQCGFLDGVVPRAELRTVLVQLLRLHCGEGR